MRQGLRANVCPRKARTRTLAGMADVAYFYPPPYQRAPAGSRDSLGSAPSTGGGVAAQPASVGGDGPPDETKVGPPGQLYIDRRNATIYQAQA